MGAGLGEANYPQTTEPEAAHLILDPLPLALVLIYGYHRIAIEDGL